MPIDLQAFHMEIVFGCIVLATVLFVTQRLRFDVIAILLLSVLLITGVLEPDQALSGFSNRATVTIGAMFVVAEGVRRTGGLRVVSRQLVRLGEQNPTLVTVVMLLVIGVLSAFINNTAAVAVFIPVVFSLSRELEISPSRVLLPLSFVSMLGGVCTLVGTSTNILVSSVAVNAGLEPFGMFEFTPLGVILFGSGFLYLMTVGRKLLPDRRESEQLMESFEMNEFLTEVEVEAESDHIGDRADRSALLRNLDLEIVQVFRSSGELSSAGPQAELREGDVLRVRGTAGEIKKLVARGDVHLVPPRVWQDVDMEPENAILVEAVVAPDSPLKGQKLRELDLYEDIGAVVLALRRGGELQREDLGEVALSGGDSLLLSLEKERLPNLKQNRSFVMVSEIGLPSYRQKRMPLAVGILVAVVLLAALNVLPLVTAAIAGAATLVLTRCVTSEEAVDAINWKVIFLLGGLLPLGVAMAETGAAEMVASQLLRVLQPWGQHAVLAGFFLFAVVLANLIGNQSTAALMAPIVLQAAQSMGVNPRTLLVGITFAASLSFLSPVSYQTNTMVYGPGNYKFTDFTRVGLPLDLLFWVICTALIPVFWPFG